MIKSVNEFGFVEMSGKHTCRVKHCRTDMSLDTVFIFTTRASIAMVIAKDDATFSCRYWTRMRITTQSICTLKSKFAQ